MHELDLKAVGKRVRYKSYKGSIGKKCKNLFLDKIVDKEKSRTIYKRNFSTTKLNEKWVTDVTEMRVGENKLYLSAMMDLHNREIVAYDVSIAPNFKQITRMMNIAWTKLSETDNLIIHSDQGWQYQMQEFQDDLKKHGVKQSMSRKGNCLDNAVMENFFGILKKEMYYGHEDEFKTVENLKNEIENYINYYNNFRITKTNNYQKPSSCRQI